MKEIKLKYCKRCKLEVKPIKTPKTAGKRIANFIGFIGGARVFSYPKRCPKCGKSLESDRVTTYIFVGGAIIIAIIVIIVIIAYMNLPENY